MKGLLIVAHGSKSAETTAEIGALTQKLERLLDGRYDLVAAAYLQWASPAAAEKVQEYIDRGVTEMLIVPYLLATGRHVAADIPNLAAQVRAEHPEVAVRVTPHIGAAAGMPTLMLEHLAKPVDRDGEGTP